MEKVVTAITRKIEEVLANTGRAKFFGEHVAYLLDRREEIKRKENLDEKSADKWFMTKLRSDLPAIIEGDMDTKAKQS